MNVNRMAVRNYAAVLALTFALCIPLVAQKNTAPNLLQIRIDNFGRINENYYRGAQPDGHDFADLAAIGIKTVIDLTRDGRDDEQAIVERNGMKFYRIPLTTSDRPSNAAVAQFLKLVTDPAAQPVFVHCQGGRHRTGAMTAVYRMTQDGWTANQAYAEMKRFRFEGFPGHPKLKDFVFDYYAQRATRELADEHTVQGGVSK